MLAEATGLSRCSRPTTPRSEPSPSSVFGAGRGVDDLVYLNGGASGIGAGVIVGGDPLDRHRRLRGRDRPHPRQLGAASGCHCGAIGCLETEVGQARAAARCSAWRSADRPTSSTRRSPRPSQPVPRCAREVERQLGYLAVALRNAINVFNPQLVVLGGFLGSLHALAPERLEAAGRGAGAGRRRGERLAIARAELGSRLLMIGAAELAFAPLLARRPPDRRAAAPARARALARLARLRARSWHARPPAASRAGSRSDAPTGALRWHGRHPAIARTSDRIDR